MLINGVESNDISALDRGLLYGDGLFETIMVRAGIPEFWPQHIDRLMSGCERLHIPIPDRTVLKTESMKLCDNIKEGVLKIIVTRGVTGRGYSVSDEVRPTRIIALHPATGYPNDHWIKGVVLRICNTRLGQNPQLAGIKHLNRLEQVLARAEWDNPDIHEGLMLDTDNHVIEGTMSNLFCIKDGNIITADLSRCGIKGILREQVFNIASELNIPVIETTIELDNLYNSDEIMITNSVIGIWPVRQLEKYQFVPGPVYHLVKEALNNRKHGWEDAA
ncbi:aminodeoxychorismate lyase [Kaarinaea lacus]